MEECNERISSFGGDRDGGIGLSVDIDAIFGGGSSSALLSGSSGIASFDSAVGLLPVLFVDSLVGDLMSRDVVGLELLAPDVAVFRGLIGVIREDVDEGGLFGAVEATPPKVVLRVLSMLGSVLDVRELGVPIVEALGGRLFSSRSALVPSSLVLDGAFRSEEVTGRVGGLLIVLPAVRDANALVLLGVGDAGVLLLVLILEDEVVDFFVSSVAGLRGGLAPVVVRLSIITHYFVTVPFVTSLLNSRLSKFRVRFQQVLAVCEGQFHAHLRVL